MTACNMEPPTLTISPPLFNSASPWATTIDDLRALYDCPSTGAVTTRTSLMDGFDHETCKHQYVFFDPNTHDSSREQTDATAICSHTASLNNLGYSPVKLEDCFTFIQSIAAERRAPHTSAPPTPRKGFIVSVAGKPSDVGRSYVLVAQAQEKSPDVPLAVEVSLNDSVSSS